MKKIYIAVLFMLAAAALSAQTGLFGISYGDTLNKADSLMSQQGFVAREIEGSMVKYSSDYNKLVDAVALFVDPETEIVAGWFVTYSKENTKEQDSYILDQLHRMHGEAVLADRENERLSWIFSDTRSVTCAYSSSGNLCVYYHDFSRPELFSLAPTAQIGLPEIEQGSE
jgi:hypothetical protein